MEFIDLQVESFDESVIEQFWQSVVAAGLENVTLDFNTEVGSLSATEVDWISKSHITAMGVRVNSITASERWDSLSESDIPDSEFERLMTNDANAYLKQFVASKPSQIQVSARTIDGSPAK